MRSNAQRRAIVAVNVRARRALRLMGLLVAVTALLGLSASPALAWKPNAHLFTGDQAWRDATDGDGAVTIGGRDYPVPALIVDALSKHRDFYNLGVIGPDGTPDLTYGQAVIHPGSSGTFTDGAYPGTQSTGAWMSYVYRKAWEAQVDPGLSGEDRGQILAFAYGYLTHAAGDMWGHTVVNDLAGGVFPSIGDLPKEPFGRAVGDAAIALRHIIVEGYM